jgi:hypothetical protein
MVSLSLFVQRNVINSPSDKRLHRIGRMRPSVSRSVPGALSCTFGVSDRGRLLVVAHTEEDETNRIISARLASKGERKLYEEG